MDKETVKRAAVCANLKLSEEELKKFTKEFSAVLEAFSKLDNVNTDKTKPSFGPIHRDHTIHRIHTIHPITAGEALRDDIIKGSLTQKESLALTEHKKDGYFKGPKVV